MVQQGSPVRLTGGDHVVHFYDTEPALVELVGSYLAASALDGDSLIVIATAEHLGAFVAAMAGVGVDIEAARTAGRLVLVDAAATLSLFMSGALPDPGRFDSVVGTLVRRAATGGRPVRVYGEMVARLWADGNAAGAAQVERLWNSLGAQTPLGLFCAYPRSLMAHADTEEGFGEVCALHSAVVDGAPNPSSEAWRRFIASPAAARRARLYVSSTLSSWDRRDVHDAAVIAVAELAANAVAHAGGDFTVGLTRLADRLRLEVGDTAAVEVKERHSPSWAEGGRGLAMVAAVADRWGCDVIDDGKVVWAEFATSRATEEARA